VFLYITAITLQHTLQLIHYNIHKNYTLKNKLQHIYGNIHITTNTLQHTLQLINYNLHITTYITTYKLQHSLQLIRYNL